VQLVEQTLIFITAANLNLLDFLDITIIAVVQIAFYLGFYIGGKGISLDGVVYWLAISGFVLIKKYQRYRHELNHYNNTNTRQKEEKSLQVIVSNLLPTHILHQMHQHTLRDKAHLTDEFQNVSILFADIHGFTDYCDSHSNEECVKLVSRLFTSFDKLVLDHNLYKMYTIGDCYVIISFVNGNNREEPVEECKNLLKVGLKMIKIIRDVAIDINFHELSMRIGIHTGKIIGGVLGTEIVRYDIYGEDVLIANNMESEGKENEVHISESTKRLLELNDKDNLFTFKDHTAFVNQDLNINIRTYLADYRNKMMLE
jgi:phospholipid-translocating ATPase